MPWDLEGPTLGRSSRRVSILALVALSLAAWADGGVGVPLADTRGSSDMPAEELLAALVTANLVSSNCPGFGVADGEWALI